MKYTIKDIVPAMRNDVVEVHFIKENGEKRVMKGTLKEDLLPDNAPSVEEQNIFHSNHPGLVQCYDVIKNGWRSFNVDSVYYLQGCTP